MDKDKLRPCEFIGNEKGSYGELPRWDKGWFHGLVQWAGYNRSSGGTFQEAGPLLVIEDEHGKFHEMEPRKVRMTDREGAANGE